MNFLIHFTFPPFFKALAAGSTVYAVVYSEVVRDKAAGFVLLTSEGGVANGTIHAIRMTINDDEEDKLALAREAYDKIEEFLSGKGITVSQGVLLTAGLHDALRYWGNASALTLKELEETLDSGKDVTLNERR